MAVPALARRQVTRAEYRLLPEGPPHYELIDGELVEMTQPRRRHIRLSVLLTRLFESVERRFGGELQTTPNLYLPGIEEVYHPDLVYVEAGRMEIVHERGIEGTPTVIGEILSRSTERVDRGRKMRDFRSAGVPHVWLFHQARPLAVEEYALGPGGDYVRRCFAEAPEVWRPAAFPGWEVPLAELDAALASTPDAAPDAE